MSIEEIARILRTAETAKQPCAPIRNYIDQQDVATAYRIQQANIEEKLNHGQRQVGKKIGLTSKKVQAQLGVDQPDFGILLDRMQIENHGTIPDSELMQPKAEAEIAFVLKKDLASENPDMETVISAIDYAVAAIEITGSRIQDWDITIADTIADNASASHFVLGNKKVKLDDIDLEACGMTMAINGKTASQGNGKACLGNPLKAVQWLARKMRELGNPLKADEIVLSGALGPMAAIKKGDRVKACIDGFDTVDFEVI